MVVTGFVVCLLAEGDLYFTARLQNYTAVEKDEVILSCELSKATAEVKWFKDGKEIFPSKNIVFQSDGKKRMLVIKKAAKSSVGSYACDCGTDKTTANLNIEGNACCDDPRSGPQNQAPPTGSHSPPLRPSFLCHGLPCRVYLHNPGGQSNPPHRKGPLEPHTEPFSELWRRLCLFLHCCGS